MEITLVFPHQLFEKNPAISVSRPVCLAEEYLFFRQYAFHKQKLAFHRASMKFYGDYLTNSGIQVHYVESSSPLSDVRKLIVYLKEKGIQAVHYVDPTDNWLEKRLLSPAKENGITCKKHPSPMFLNTPEDLWSFFKTGQKRYFQTSFYIDQRRKYGILTGPDGEPEGGKWSFDQENRKKYPAKKVPPAILYPQADRYFTEAVTYVETHFPDNPGILHAYPLYPYNYEGTQKWLQQFLEQRFAGFGPYEDAIVASESILHHSVLTPMLNAGLITPGEVLGAVLAFHEKNPVPIATLEGFIRQVMGWREFIRGVYEAAGSKERTINFWGFTRKIPPSFYDGTTGIGPVDITIRKILKTGYCHHIERLMVLGNFMLLCEFDPDEVYRWFMEMFIDAYDWVMVPNVYGMSQFADGGMMATKPYISGSNYLMKMSDYKPGTWQDTWDALFWRFMHVHRDFFQKNPRLGMLVKSYDKMHPEKREKLLYLAEDFLKNLD
jgi:deoxyribodipyrimidine photolyase-related protein